MLVAGIVVVLVLGAVFRFYHVKYDCAISVSSFRMPFRPNFNCERRSSVLPDLFAKISISRDGTPLWEIEAESRASMTNITFEYGKVPNGWREVRPAGDLFPHQVYSLNNGDKNFSIESAGGGIATISYYKSVVVPKRF